MGKTVTWLKQPINVGLLLGSLAPMIMIVMFIERFKANVPRVDHGWNGIHIFPPVFNNEMTFGALFREHFGHLLLLPNLQSIFFIRFTGWNINVESYTAFVLAVGCYGLLLWLVHRCAPVNARWAMVPFSVLLFALNHDSIWIVVLFTQWLYPPLLLLISIIVLLRANRWTALITAAFLSLLATVSNGNGIVLWGALLFTIWFSGRYPRWVVLPWIAGAIGSLLLYIDLANVIVIAGDEAVARGTRHVDIGNFVLLVQFVLAMMGNTFVSQPQNWHYSSYVGAVGIVLFLMNGIVLWRQRHRYHLLTMWIPLVLYSITSALLVGLVRRDNYADGAGASVFEWYRMVSVFLWIPVVTLMIFAFHESRRTVKGINWVGIVGMVILFPISNVMEMQEETFRFRHYREGCYMRLLFTQNYDEIQDDRCFTHGGLYINLLSVYRLALFHELEPVQILPAYREGVPVVVESDSAWANYHIRDWLLADVSEEQVLSFTADATIVIRDEIPAKPGFIFHVEEPTQQVQAPLYDLLGGQLTELWYVRPADTQTLIPDLWAFLDAQMTTTDYNYLIDGEIKLLITHYRQ